MGEGEGLPDAGADLNALKGERNDDEWTGEKDRQGKIVEGAHRGSTIFRIRSEGTQGNQAHILIV